MKWLGLVICVLWSIVATAQVEPLINNDWKIYTWPYNAYYPINVNGTHGHVGNACGPTVMARALHYYQSPVNGTGTINYIDNQEIHWTCALDTLNLIYNDMPYQISNSAPQSVYHETAKLFLACAAMGAKYRIGSFEGLFRMKDALTEHMFYDTAARIINRWEYTRDEWIEMFRSELDNNRPIIICGRSANSPPPWEPGNFEGHYFICDGYNDEGDFYMNYSFEDIKGYFDIDSMHYFRAYHRALINLKPVNLGRDDVAYNDRIVVKLIQYPGMIDKKLIVYASPGYSCFIQLLNIDGSHVKTLFNGILEARQFDLHFSGEHLSKGVYLVSIVVDKQAYCKKIIVS